MRRTSTRSGIIASPSSGHPAPGAASRCARRRRPTASPVACPRRRHERLTMLPLTLDPEVELRDLRLADADMLESLKAGFTAHRGEWLYRGSAAAFIATHAGGGIQEASAIGVFVSGRLAGVLTCRVAPERR